MYTLYIKWKNNPKASNAKVYTYNLDAIKEIADEAKKSWWGQHVYEWVRVKDQKTGQYVYEA